MKLAEYVDQAHGRQTELARSLGVDPQLVWQWSREVREVPMPRCAPIELATGGAVRRWDLRPTDWHINWPELVGTAGAPELVAVQGT